MIVKAWNLLRDTYRENMNALEEHRNWEERRNNALREVHEKGEESRRRAIDDISKDLSLSWTKVYMLYKGRIIGSFNTYGLDFWSDVPQSIKKAARQHKEFLDQVEAKEESIRKFQQERRDVFNGK